METLTRKLAHLISGLTLAVLLVACNGAAGGLAGAAGDSPVENLTPANPTFTHPDGITVTLAAGQSARISVGSIPREVFQAGGNDDIETALNALPSYLEMRSTLYTLSLRDSSDDAVLKVAITIPAGSEPLQTLDLYGWDEETGQWVFVAGHVDAATNLMVSDEFPATVALFQTSPVTPLISTMLETSEAMDSSVTGLNMVFPSGLQVQPDGTLNGVLAPGWQIGAGYAVLPLIRGNGIAIAGLLNNEAGRALHIQDLVGFTVGGNYNGVAIDYQNVSPGDQMAFTAFLTELKAALAAQNKLLAVVLPTPGGNEGEWNTGGYDWRAIGQIADAVILQTDIDPRSYAIDGDTVKLLTWAVGEISRVKIHVATSTLSVARRQDNSLALIGYGNALSTLGVVHLPPPPEDQYRVGDELSFRLTGQLELVELDPKAGAYTYTLAVNDQFKRVWLITSSVIRSRLDLLSAFNIGGVTVNHLLSGGADPSMMTAINELKAQSASSVSNQLVMKWTVSGASGAVLSGATGLGTPFVWKPEQSGDYTIKGELVGASVADMGSSAFSVGNTQQDKTPTPPPPTKAPSGGNNNPPPATTQPPPADTPPPTTPPPGGAATGGFQLGGQVPNAINHAGLMQHAGMSWVKFQIVWPLTDAGTAGAFVAAGHQAGFKVLLSVKGQVHPQSIDYNAFTSYMTQIAQQGPDAIEVWNEMNFNIEWPKGEISGSNYVTKMLAPAYQAIKGVNSNILVISGAPTPTGFFGGCGESATPDGSVIAGCDDWFYLQQMRDAGAANYMDCMGVHFNAGATAPSATTGHPADGGDHHYTWYFTPMLNLYYGTLGKTLCFTEIGYVTGEGLGTLPPNWSWGNGTSLAEQAAWLAEAAVMSAQSNKVRLMIIWNVDFTVWGNDPQAGYAIVRPDGTCPACDALHNVMN